MELCTHTDYINGSIVAPLNSNYIKAGDYKFVFNVVKLINVVCFCRYITLIVKFYILLSVQLYYIVSLF